MRALGIAIVLAALVFSAYIAYRNRDVPHFALQHDDSVYVVCAKSLAEGKGYRILSLPGEPYQTKYPPAYPALLSVLWRINPRFPENLTLLLAASWLAFPVCILVVWCWLRQPLVCALLAMNAYYLFYSMTLGTDIAATAAILAVLWFAEKSGRMNAIAAGLLAGFACLVRLAALPLLVSVPLVYLWRKRHRDALLFCGASVPIAIAWLCWARAHAPHPANPFTVYYTSYLGFVFQSFSWKDVGLMPWKNLAAICLSVSRYVFFDFGFGSDWQRILTALLTIATVSGIIRLTRRAGALQYPIFAALYVGQLMLWTLPEERFLLPLAPLIYAGLLSESAHAWHLIRKAWHAKNAIDRVAAPVLASVLICAMLTSVICNLYGFAIYMPAAFAGYRERFREREPLFQWLAQWEQRDAVIISSKDPLVYLRTGLSGYSMVLPAAVQYDPTPDRYTRHFLSIQDYAHGAGANYFLLEPKLYELYLSPERVSALCAAINRHRSFEPVFKTGTMTLFRIASSDSPRDSMRGTTEVARQTGSTLDLW